MGTRLPVWGSVRGVWNPNVANVRETNGTVRKAQSAPHVSLELMKSNSAGPFQASSFRFRHLPYPRIVLTGNIAFIHTRLQFLEFFNLRFQKSANTVQNWQAADSPPPSELERSKIQRYFMCSSLRQP